jgi:L,D-peptidoglycan transpeptidase YkuD (ErfK/YbiS/YcfS/YnhG family)
MRADTAWCENPDSRNYNRPVAAGADATDRMWREDALYDLTFVLDQNFTARAKNRGSAIFFHIARETLSPTAGCVAIPAAAMRRLAPHLARGARMIVE